MVEQYRHGTGERTLEFPSGIIEPGEDACAAGLRELEEETGYCAGGCRLLGRVQPNSALQDNELAVVSAWGCTATGRTALDPGEDVTVHLFTPAEVTALIESGRIRHALALITWGLYERSPAR